MLGLVTKPNSTTHPINQSEVVWLTKKKPNYNWSLNRPNQTNLAWLGFNWTLTKLTKIINSISYH